MRTNVTPSVNDALYRDCCTRGSGIDVILGEADFVFLSLRNRDRDLLDLQSHSLVGCIRLDAVCVPLGLGYIDPPLLVRRFAVAVHLVVHMVGNLIE